MIGPATGEAKLVIYSLTPSLTPSPPKDNDAVNVAKDTSGLWDLSEGHWTETRVNDNQEKVDFHLLSGNTNVEWSLSLLRRHESEWDWRFMGRNFAVWELVLRPYADMILPWLDNVDFTTDPPVVPFFELAMKGELDAAALNTIAKLKTAFGPGTRVVGMCRSLDRPNRS